MNNTNTHAYIGTRTTIAERASRDHLGHKNRAGIKLFDVYAIYDNHRSINTSRDKWKC